MEDLILMITPSVANYDALRRAAAAAADGWQVRRASDIPSALARVAGGGIGFVVLDISQEASAQAENLPAVAAAVADLPVLAWADTDSPGLAGFVAGSGAAGYLTRDTAAMDLTRLRAGTPRPAPAPKPFQASPPAAPSRATILSVMGAKGGVGATTLALNLAAALTAQGSVILAEVRSSFGTLHSHFRPGRLVRGLTSLRADRPSVSALWPAPNIPGLRILFAPQTMADCRELDPAEAVSILYWMGSQADFLVTDLPVSFTEANRAILGASHYLTMVVEPLPHCLRLARMTLDGIQGWERTPASVGAVVVRRSAESGAFPVADIDAELGVPVTGVLPPAPELCIRAERTSSTLIQCDPESLIAESVMTLSQRFAPQRMPPASSGGYAAHRETVLR